MKKYTALLPLLFLLLCLDAAAAENPRTEFEQRRREIAANLEAATIWIVAEDDNKVFYGTGFIVGEGYIATNAHVIRGLGRGTRIRVLNERLPVCEAKIVAQVYDEEEEAGARDFALLRFTPPRGADLPVLPFSLELRRMDRVSAWGYPDMATRFDVSTERTREGDTGNLKQSPPVIYTEGTVNAIVRTRFGEAILHSAPIASGNSGGPLVNGRGEVVGINTWGYKEEDEGAFINGAQPSSQLLLFLEAHGVFPRLAEGQAMPSGSARPSSGDSKPSDSARPSSADSEPSGSARPSPAGPESAGSGAKPSGPKLEPEYSDPGRIAAKPAPSRIGQAPDAGGIRDMGGFSVLVPPGWSVLDEEANMILLGSDDNEASIGILIRDSNGQSLRQTAKELSRQFDGTRPELEDDVYMFSFSDDGVDTMLFVGEGDNEGEVFILFIAGDAEHAGVDEILDSIE